jgi:UDP-2,4-diacetamido-2,4,6-trideoxy-beta-L-altropyranose hydrolase
LNIAFRVDASSSIGIGHLMRCLALSEELTKRGNNCFFVTKTESNELINRIMKNKVYFQKINPNATLKEDEDIVIKFSNENHIDWIITDHYGLNSEYIKEIKKHNFNVLSIDDTAKIHYYSDIVLNQNIGSDELKFSKENYTNLLLGTKYVMIRNQLLKREDKIERKNVKKILIMLGGTDEDNLMLSIIKMLEGINNKIEFFVIIGPLNPNEDLIKEYIDKLNLKFKLIKSPKDMSKIYLESDIAISAGGSSCYELAYFGIPNIIISIADNQLEISKELDNQKIGIYLGTKNEITKEKLENKLKELINNGSLRQTLSKNGKKLVDGKGKVRIVEFMERYN